ncbi:MAG: hypothetical protein KKB20_26230 [Proteobacteria bacterium]|nr:hypothetical protein [Pseudomonadota bacterium]
MSRSSINPGYAARVRDEPFMAPPGPDIRCPQCKKTLGQGRVVVFYTRCKHCRKWVLLKREVDP